ncbi:hypothetical protein J4N02_14825 [Propioniciclava sp. MC1595]|uniref:hypothetical protein n=1 Tax=Propioniciclava sp. MC1595 TaxID=2760308 RepID=UPI0016628AE9|nr:hypothetical protein [Propioniciclava sp. MC1595]MBB1496156.1 hypothetical protein [Propioniciclava sp. MC1595]QTE25743.1 hypothetical protein J4N02_14825 [Propioniciclava sp. MC1595]
MISNHSSNRRGFRKVRRNRDWGFCATTGKVRYGEMIDAKKALESAFHQRAAARLAGITSSNQVVRAYRCDDCRGYHTTSIPHAAYTSRRESLALV